MFSLTEKINSGGGDDGDVKNPSVQHLMIFSGVTDIILDDVEVLRNPNVVMIMIRFDEKRQE